MTTGKWDQNRVREFALSFPEAHAGAHHGRTDLRVRNKIFATLPEDGSTVNLKTTPIALDMLLREDPQTFRDAWGGRWVAVALERVEAAMLRELLAEAYCSAAPKGLVAELRSREAGSADS